MGQVVDVLKRAIARSGKTQAQIAHEAGFGQPNMISMLKSGRTQLPANRAEALARALDLEAADLLRLCLQEYEPELWASLNRVFRMDLSRSEAQFIDAVRALKSEAASPRPSAKP